MSTQKLYVFFKYDICPYMLGGEIDFFYPDGKVAPKNYPGFCVEPLAILPEEAGHETLEQLKELGKEYSAKYEGLRNDYKARARRLIGLDT